MNSEMLKGSWNQIKGNVKQAFGKLTDDDLMQIEGSLDQAVGILQQRYGYTKERALEEWDKFVSGYNRAHNSITDTANDYVLDKGSQAVKDAGNFVRNKVDAVREKVNM